MILESVFKDVGLILMVIKKRIIIITFSFICFNDSRRGLRSWEERERRAVERKLNKNDYASKCDF